MARTSPGGCVPTARALLGPPAELLPSPFRPPRAGAREVVRGNWPVTAAAESRTLDRERLGSGVALSPTQPSTGAQVAILISRLGDTRAGGSLSRGAGLSVNSTMGTRRHRDSSSRRFVDKAICLEGNSRDLGCLTIPELDRAARRGPGAGADRTWRRRPVCREPACTGPRPHSFPSWVSGPRGRKAVCRGPPSDRGGWWEGTNHEVYR
jgi:hypothetical protein